MKIGIIVCAAGKGTRVGGDIPKQFIKIGEKRVIDYTLDNILMSGVFDDVILVIRPGDRHEYENYWGRVLFVDGDTEDGQNSRRLGLKYAKDVLGYEDDDLIGVADGNRPFVQAEFYKRLIEEAKEFGNAIPYVIQRDILVREKDGKTGSLGCPRSEIRATIAPIVFRFGEFWDVYDKAYENGTLKDSEGAVNLLIDRLLQEGREDELHFVKGDIFHFKITTQDDVEMAKLIMKGLEN